MTAPVAASKGLSEAIKPLQADLFVLRGKTKPRRKGRAPIDYELHVNPLGIGIAAVGAGAALWLMQLRMQPNYIDEQKWVVDTPAYEETIPHAGSGHWETDSVPYGEPSTIWVEGSWVRGTYRPGHWITYQPTVPVADGKQHWVVDLENYTTTVKHAEQGHWELTGKKVKKYSVERRKGFGDASTTGFEPGTGDWYTVLFEPMGLAKWLGMYPK